MPAIVVEQAEAYMGQIHPIPSSHMPTVSESGAGHKLLYQIEVKRQGCCVAQHVVEAADALAAINLVERYYGEPVEVETVCVEDEEGNRRHTLVVKNWHGYTFDARVIEP